MLHWFCGFVHISQRTVLRPKPALACLCRLVAAAIIFLLTATRDEQLFRALAEAAQNVVDKKGHWEQQRFWWWNIFVFWRVLLLAVLVIPQHGFLKKIKFVEVLIRSFQFLDAPGHSFMFLCNEPRKAVGKLLWSVVWRTCFLPLCWWRKGLAASVELWI